MRQKLLHEGLQQPVHGVRLVHDGELDGSHHSAAYVRLRSPGASVSGKSANMYTYCYGTSTILTVALVRRRYCELEL